ncbi:MAG: cytochrome d ubiquinol oxidase subunit II [Microbacteriaceae bacterium]|nr:cytochrome d ubiquinol oxidase subunit II [Microbacteriaceae bacterium]
MDLAVLWFFIVGFLFIGYFVLDGFDFGVGMALPLVSKDETDRRVVINSIGPVWDLNETWVIVAGASLFAAFPEWYASLFSGFYLPLLLILIALILRGVSFEYRHQKDSVIWRRNFDLMIIIGSALPALLWGVAFANIVQGVALDSDHNYIGGFFALLNLYALLGGLTTLLLFLLHGLHFLSLKTDGDIKDRSHKLAVKIGLVTIVVAATFLIWTHLMTGSLISWILAVLAAVSLVAGWLFNLVKRDGLGFAALAFTVVFAVASLFLALFPDVFPASNDPANSLTIWNASSSEYTLTVMSWTALVFLPLIIGYQAWTYWVFRKRVTRQHVHSNVH